MTKIHLSLFLGKMVSNLFHPEMFLLFFPPYSFLYSIFTPVTIPVLIIAVELTVNNNSNNNIYLFIPSRNKNSSTCREHAILERILFLPRVFLEQKNHMNFLANIANCFL